MNVKELKNVDQNIFGLKQNESEGERTSTHKRDTAEVTEAVAR